MDRRSFIKLTAVTGGATAIAACSTTSPENQLIRFIPDEDLTPGIAELKNGICPICSAGCGTTVRVMQGDAEIVRDGQPGVMTMSLDKKLEGNPSHPISQGALCPRGQASIQITYHPDRLIDAQAFADPQAELGRLLRHGMGRHGDAVVEPQLAVGERIEGDEQGHHLGDRRRMADLVGRLGVEHLAIARVHQDRGITRRRPAGRPRSPNRLAAPPRDGGVALMLVLLTAGRLRVAGGLLGRCGVVTLARSLRWRRNDQPAGQQCGCQPCAQRLQS